MIREKDPVYDGCYQAQTGQYPIRYVWSIFRDRLVGDLFSKL